MQLHALAHRIGDERAAHDEQVLVGGCDLVEVAVAAHQREQLGEVRFLGDVDPGHLVETLSLARRVPGPARDASGNAEKTEATRTVQLAKLKKSNGPQAQRD